MSEYQYYEFQAIDRPLTEKEMAEVRTWLAKLPAGEKDDFLVRVLAGDGSVASELAQRMQRERGASGDTARPAPRRRTVAELLRKAERDR